MKRSNFKTLWILALLMMGGSVFAQKTYTLSASNNWSSVLPSTCFACTISIPSGTTLTMDESATCQNCTFEGGTLSINNLTLNIQYAGSLTTTNFNGTNVQVSGNSGKVIVNAPLSLTNSTFTFNNSSSLTTSYEVDLSASIIYLYDNASMTSTGGSSTPINLVNSSQIVIGNGSQTSTAMFTVSGPTLMLYDKSSVDVANVNNVYYNWASYTHSPNENANSNANKSYTTNNLNLNCGSGYAHSCSNPSLYGPATLSSGGVVPGNTLPVVLVGFNAILNSDHTVTLDWNTQMESNFSHFTIERSADGENWTVAGTVQAKGNSSVETEYSFIDEQPLAGTNFYRLMLVNLDNSYGYTEVKVVSSSVIAKISFFPNPARDYVNVSLAGASGAQVTVLLTSVSGRLMEQKTASAASGTIVTFSVQNFAAGIYILSVIGSDGSRQSSTMLISRS